MDTSEGTGKAEEGGDGDLRAKLAALEAELAATRQGAVEANAARITAERQLEEQDAELDAARRELDDLARKLIALESLLDSAPPGGPTPPVAPHHKRVTVDVPDRSVVVIELP